MAGKKEKSKKKKAGKKKYTKKTIKKSTAKAVKGRKTRKVSNTAKKQEITDVNNDFIGLINDNQSDPAPKPIEEGIVEKNPVNQEPKPEPIESIFDIDYNKINQLQTQMPEGETLEKNPGKDEQEQVSKPE